MRQFVKGSFSGSPILWCHRLHSLQSTEMYRFERNYTRLKKSFFFPFLIVLHFPGHFTRRGKLSLALKGLPSCHSPTSCTHYFVHVQIINKFAKARVSFKTAHLRLMSWKCTNIQYILTELWRTLVWTCLSYWEDQNAGVYKGRCPSVCISAFTCSQVHAVD